MKAPAWKQGLAARKPGGEEEKADRDAAPSHGSKYRDYEPKRRDSMEYKEPVYYGGSARRRQEESASDGYRRHYEADEHSRHSRYAERDHYSDSRAYRGGRYDRRSYEDDRGHYGESRTYRSSRYDDHPKYRKSSYHYDDRDHYSDRYDRYDRYERYDRYDRYRRSGRSYSPQTPYSDRRSPNPRKAYYSPPPPPPSDAVPVAKAPPVGEPGATKRERASNPVAAAPPGPGGAGPAAGHGQAKAREEPKAADASQKKESKIPDPRAGTNLYAARMTTALEIVSLPRVAAADASLASPPFDMQAEWRAPNPSAGAFQSPLERINAYLCTPRPQVSREWWLKGEDALAADAGHSAAVAGAGGAAVSDGDVRPAAELGGRDHGRVRERRRGGRAGRRREARLRAVVPKGRAAQVHAALRRAGRGRERASRAVSAGGGAGGRRAGGGGQKRERERAPGRHGAAGLRKRAPRDAVLVHGGDQLHQGLPVDHHGLPGPVGLAGLHGGAGALVPRGGASAAAAGAAARGGEGQAERGLFAGADEQGAGGLRAEAQERVPADLRLALRGAG
ncbi:pre-mRNA-processing ATP-dependent RNA helicase prp5 [Babesia caballi]|uniref:Pre-mRNA-processing ATP-dependent RNA helicase prp5 n=1 Tax=Babesia caballi TaxID=5871 RepID=A0AAV4M0G4_BABCB|nr:pre-mRNA-processing ATP-dependent RNA helicase prp5 [Babesia caballi]